MLVRKCDVCGKICLDLDCHFNLFVESPNGNSVLGWSDEDGGKEVELCDSCLANLKKWLKIKN